jgi:hypothetical protein
MCFTSLGRSVARASARDGLVSGRSILAWGVGVVDSACHRRAQTLQTSSPGFCGTVTDLVKDRLGRELEVGGLAGTFQAAMSDGGAQLPVIRAYDHLRHALTGSAVDTQPVNGSIWRALIVAHWRASLEVISACPLSVGIPTLCLTSGEVVPGMLAERRMRICCLYPPLLRPPSL